MYSTLQPKHSRLDRVIARFAAERINITATSLLQVKGYDSWLSTLIDVFLK